MGIAVTVEGDAWRPRAEASMGRVRGHARANHPCPDHGMRVVGKGLEGPAAFTVDETRVGSLNSTSFSVSYNACNPSYKYN